MTGYVNVTEPAAGVRLDRYHLSEPVGNHVVGQSFIPTSSLYSVANLFDTCYVDLLSF